MRNAEEIRKLSDTGIDILSDLAVIATEEKLHGDSREKQPNDKEMDWGISTWAKMRDIFARIFG